MAHCGYKTPVQSIRNGLAVDHCTLYGLGCLGCLQEPGEMTTKPANVQARRETDPSFATSLSIIISRLSACYWTFSRCWHCWFIFHAALDGRGRGRREKVIPDGSGERWLFVRIGCECEDDSIG